MYMLRMHVISVSSICFHFDAIKLRNSTAPFEIDKGTGLSQNSLNYQMFKMNKFMGFFLTDTSGRQK